MNSTPRNSTPRKTEPRDNREPDKGRVKGPDKGILIISFDCEGKWGVADQISGHGRNPMTNYNLIEAYRKIINLLNRHEIAATFAFVGALTLSPKEYLENKELFTPRVYKGSNWLQPFLSQLENGKTDGWLCSKLLDITRVDGHELTTHGFCHVPFSEQDISAQDIKKEFQAINIWRKIKGLRANTLIYPRNIEGFKDQLAANGITGYRVNEAKSSNTFKRACSLLSETNIFTPSQGMLPDEQKNIIRIPGGYFLNWRAGYRRYIPSAITLRRWKNLIDHAVAHKGIIHLFSHPHNFINGKDQFSLFDHILGHAAQRIKEGALINLTQEKYCETAKNIGRLAESAPGVGVGVGVGGGEHKTQNTANPGTTACKGVLRATSSRC